MLANSAPIKAPIAPYYLLQLSALSWPITSPTASISTTVYQLLYINFYLPLMDLKTEIEMRVSRK